MDQDHFFGDARQRQCIGDCGITAADDCDRFAAEEHAVADCTVAESMSEQFLFAGQTEFFRLCAGGQHYGVGQIRLCGGLNLF